MKKYFNLLFAFLISFFIYDSVNAETNTYKIEINDASIGHVYEAYQIFKGDLSNDKLTLSNIIWGSGVSSTFISGKDASTYASSITVDNANEKAKELGANLSSTVAGTSGEISNGTYTISGLEPGYYLIKDRNDTQSGNYDAYTEYIVKLVGDTTVTPKTSLPTADKKIVEENDTVTYSSNYAVGDVVTYRLTGTMPTNYDSYSTYRYIFHDKISEGLTLNNDSVKVFINGIQITSGFIVNTDPEDEDTLDVIFDDTKPINTINKDSVITVEYTATVNSSAVRGLPGNDNTLNIEFSNNPYTDETGKTTDIITKVYLFDIIFNKIDSKTKAALNGAEFKLERLVDGDWLEWDTITNQNSNLFAFEGLSVGTYRLTETITPDGYNTISPVIFEITAEYDEEGLLSINGTNFNFIADLNEGIINANVENVKGIVLPLTGGMGTIVFTLIGISLMGIAIIGIIKSKEEK